MSKASSPRDPSPGQREPLFGTGAPGWAFTNVGLLSLARGKGGQIRSAGFRGQCLPQRRESPGPGKALRGLLYPFFIPEPNKGGCSCSSITHFQEVRRCSPNPNMNISHSIASYQASTGPLAEVMVAMRIPPPPPPSSVPPHTP